MSMDIGENLPAFSLLGVDGKMHNQFDYADRYALLILFTSNSCPMADAYRSRIVSLIKRYEEDHLGIISINPVDPETNVRDMFIEHLHLPHLYLADTDQQVAKRFGATVTPEAFLFNSKRELIYHGAIDDCWENIDMVTRVYLEDAIEAALDGIEVDYPETEPIGCKINYSK